MNQPRGGTGRMSGDRHSREESTSGDHEYVENVSIEQMSGLDQVGGPTNSGIMLTWMVVVPIDSLQKCCIWEDAVAGLQFERLL